MKNWSAIFLIFILALTTTELGQLCRLPFMISHYYNHNQRAATSLSDFIIEHYTTDNHRDQDQGEDAQLPFKSALIPISITADAQFFHPDVAHPGITNNRPAENRHTVRITTTPPGSVFHPPPVI